MASGDTLTAESLRASIDRLQKENAALRTRLNTLTSPSPRGQSEPSATPNATPRCRTGGMTPSCVANGATSSESAVEALQSLQAQVDRMRSVLPILSIPNYTFSLVPGPGDTGTKEVPIYEIKINYGDTAYAVYRRYSEFRSLHDRLEASAVGKAENLPKFPGRQGLFRSTNRSRAAIDRRRRDLQNYLRQLVASEAVKGCDDLRNFFAQLALDPSGGASYDELSVATDE